MDAERVKRVNGNKIEEFYWNGKFVVYINNALYEGSFEDAIEKCADLCE